jgi:hypothetical protein
MPISARSLTLAAALLVGALGARAQETPAPKCSLDGLGIGKDMDFNAAANRIAPAAGSLTVSCENVFQTEVTANGARLRFTHAKFKLQPEPEREFPASLVRIERLDGATAALLGWGVVQDFAMDDDVRLFPQVVRKGDALLISIAPRHRHIYSLVGETFTRVPAFEWRDDLKIDPALAKSGQPLGLDLRMMEGRLALFRESDNPPAGQSAADTPKVALANLDFKDGKLVVISQEIADAHDEDLLADPDATAEVRRTIKNLPQGAEPCAISGWSIDLDPHGLNVRAGPSATAKVLGVVPPPLVFTEKDNSEFGAGLLYAEFAILGYRDGWFLIENIEPPGAPYGRKYSRALPQPYKGRGWVSASMVGAQQGNWAPSHGLLLGAPNRKSRSYPARDEGDKPYNTEARPAHVRACSGRWGYVETKAGSRGWTTNLCSNQVTTCG